MPIPAKLENVVQETSNIKTFFVRPEKPLSFKAGQFIALTVPGIGEAPFTPSSDKKSLSADADTQPRESG